LIDIIFFLAGLFALIAGKLPKTVINLLFGKGEYIISATRLRLIGLLLTIPLPASFILSTLVAVLFGYQNTIIMSIVEISFMVTAFTVAVTFIQPTKIISTISSDAISPPARKAVKELSYGKRILVLLGIIVLIVFVISNFLVSILYFSLTIRDIVTGQIQFFEDLIFTGISFVIMVLSIFGIVKLVIVLRK